MLSSLLTKGIKSNFKEMEKLNECQEYFFHALWLFGIESICIYPDVMGGNYEI